MNTTPELRRPGALTMSVLWRASPRWQRVLGWVICAGVALGGASSPPLDPVPGMEAAPPTTPRQLFNAGTEQLRQGKLKEAEALLEAVLAAQRDRFQAPALYNLGHVRFAQGMEELKKGPAAAPTAARGRAAAQSAEDSLHTADEALAGDDIQRLVAAYLRGRGARKELKEAMRAVRKATETYGTTLRKWQRASGDFKSAMELNPSDVDARENSEIVDRSIARLVDTLRELEQLMSAMAAQNQKLGEKIKQLMGRIPDKDMPPGAAGDDEEDEDQPNGPKPGDKEGPVKEGKEMKLSREQAGWFLDGYKLDSEHRLPMGQEDTAEPKGRSRKPW